MPVLEPRPADGRTCPLSAPCLLGFGCVNLVSMGYSQSCSFGPRSYRLLWVWPSFSVLLLWPRSHFVLRAFLIMNA